MKSVIFEVSGEQFNQTETYTMGPIDELKNNAVYGVWVVAQDTTGGTAPILKGWQVTGERKLIISLDESQLLPTDKVIVCVMYQDKGASANPSASGSASGLIGQRI